MSTLILFIILMVVFAIVLIVLPLRKIIRIFDFRANKEEYTVVKANLIRKDRIVRRRRLRVYYMYRGLYGFTDDKGIVHEFHGPYSYNNVEKEIETYYIDKGVFKFYTKQYIESIGFNFVMLFMGIIVVLLMTLALFL